VAIDGDELRWLPAAFDAAWAAAPTPHLSWSSMLEARIQQVL
jgi:hypothetical protein